MIFAEEVDPQQSGVTCDNCRFNWRSLFVHGAGDGLMPLFVVQTCPR